jgi:Txe/YoeB family toxin of Txe-Axe toxin-antitoxin module
MDKYYYVYILKSLKDGKNYAGYTQTGAYLRRINIQHRIVYQIYEDLKTVKLIRMWTHYE